MVKGSKILRKLRLSPLSRHYEKALENGKPDNVDYDEAGELTDFTASSSASFTDFSSFSDSASFNGEDECQRKVIFSNEEDVQSIPTCKEMDSVEKQDIWYLSEELFRMKIEARALANGICSLKPDMVLNLKDCHNKATFLAESGMAEEDLIGMGNESLAKDLQRFSRNDIAGESCRGLEKTILRRERELVIDECRRHVTETLSIYKGNYSACADTIAVGYAEMSRSSTVFAQYSAAADEATAKNIRIP